MFLTFGIPLAIICFLTWFIPAKLKKGRATCYLAGKITGLPRWYVLFKFWFFEMLLRLRGFTVYNPARMIDKNTGYNDAMDICITELSKCTHAYFMFDWRDSRGAKIEFNEAAEKGKILVNQSKYIQGKYFTVKFIIKLKQFELCQK